MSIFENAIDDIFNTPDFLEYLTIENRQIPVISYDAATDALYTEYGFDNGKTISVTCKVKDYTPAKGAKVIVRGQSWKIDNWTADSHNLTYRVYLKSVESK